MTDGPKPARKSSGKRRRSHTIAFRADDAEKAKFNAIAAGYKQSVGDLMRTTLLGLPPAPARRNPKVENQLLLQLMDRIARFCGLLGNASGLLNQADRHLNRERPIEDIRDLLDHALRLMIEVLEEFRDREAQEWRHMLMQALNREHRRLDGSDDEPSDR